MIKLEGIKKIYNIGKSNAFEALHGISMEIKDNEMVAVVGTSGAGKSTLLHILAFIDDYDEGIYEFDGKIMNGLNEKKRSLLRNKKIGLVMQDYALVDDFTALENVLLPLDFDIKEKRTRKRKAELALNSLKLVDMDTFANNKCNQLSGGQKQRVAIARAIVNNPNLIIADEPTGALDSKNAKQIMEIFEDLKKRGKTILIVTHDMEIAEYADRILQIEDGMLV
ncbi:MAG: ABC transporter ATP-binding protein [Lachnospiraceae bacterium]|nr:ABC transporter ATP-binding protein [Lachnospiraceae bacterium]